MQPLTYLFQSKNTTLLVVPTHRNEIEKATNPPLRLCPNLAKETIQIGFEFKYFDPHESTTHPSESPFGRICSKTTISTLAHS